MKWKYEEYRKLYVKESDSFRMLPLYARALAAELLKICDARGRIPLLDREPWQAIAFALGATKKDRAMLREHIPMLLADGYLVREGKYLVVRNFVEAQRRRVMDEDPTEGVTPGCDAPPAPAAETEGVTPGCEPADLRLTSGELPSDLRPTSGEGSVTQPGVNVTVSPARLDQTSTREETPPIPPPGGETGFKLEAPGEPEPKRRRSKPKPGADPADVHRVFEHWRTVLEHPRAVLDAKRYALLDAAVVRHGVDECLLAVDGCKASDFHMCRPGGGNDRNRKFDSIALIFRDADHVEDFANRARAAGSKPAPSAPYHRRYEPEADRKPDAAAPLRLASGGFHG